MAWFQKTITLAPRSRGFHLITEELVRALPDLARVRVGVAHFFIQHTSASLCINENADPTVRADLESHFDILAPENEPHYRHTTEGPDDMPAHIKAALIGNSLTIPVTDGRLNLGTWQGICLCEHRDRGGARRVVVTIEGET
ncbi:MAG TPA: secondary thiamine-phosphate synthase enzyme YjbQ [Candidatus Krumholzibacteria bacterium]|jgi:secondary thiamine-phosphate synthase enzyme|nr:secondary thiamine-phosphate synthase enzyme YjbQ [Candidatus Krumholzibacteria bacterium]